MPGPHFLLRLLARLKAATGRPFPQLIGLVKSFFNKLLANDQIAELWRFIFLGTVVETGRLAGQKILDMISNLFIVKATFTSGDFAYDWVKCYLDKHQVWDESRAFSVIARNKNTLQGSKHSDVISTKSHSADGHPDPVYEPAPSVPEIFRWKGYWISVTAPATAHPTDSFSNFIGEGDTLVLRVWSRNRSVLDEFVREARESYIKSPIPPRQLKSDNDKSGALFVVKFVQGDWTWDWILNYLRSTAALQEVSEFTVTTKQSDLDWGTGPKDAVRFIPGEGIKQMFLFDSTTIGRKVWVQINMKHGYEDHRGKMSGGEIVLTFHNSNKQVVDDLLEAARLLYMQNSISRITLHLTDNYGSWSHTVTRNRRALGTLVLPDDVKENLLSDIREFLDSEDWYTLAGVPHRRGYLLYGEPGTGKSSTIHAMAGELGLEIYCISLASPGIDDHSLARLISDTPARSILLLEDIDCAFPSREDTTDMDDTEFDNDGLPTMMRTVAPKSEVTLSGLLNVLDSAQSEEGRVTFATTNHIESLDPALIRPGRMDVKVHYKLATTPQIEQVFNRFYPAELYATPEGVPAPARSYTEDQSLPSAKTDLVVKGNVHYSVEELDALAVRFGTLVPANSYSVAQLQGYLLNKKWDPVGAVNGIAKWVEIQQADKAAVEETRKKRRLDAAKRRKDFQASLVGQAPNPVQADVAEPVKDDVAEGATDSLTPEQPVAKVNGVHLSDTVEEASSET